MTQGLQLRGAVLGKGYRLGRPLNDGDDNVFEATHERIPGHFVIRLFPTETLSQPESASRIQRGARVASLLRDVRAVQVLDFNTSGEMPAFVVLEPVSGSSLAALMADEGTLPLALPLSQVLAVVDCVAGALAAGHRIGLIHGDVRPAHVVLPPSGGQPAAKLSGFGWAKELRAAARVTTPSAYLAPEQQQGKVLTLDDRVDQFALAALAYEMIAAAPPFSAAAGGAARSAADGGRLAQALSHVDGAVSARLDEVLRRALSFAPAERFGSILDFATELRSAAATAAHDEDIGGDAGERQPGAFPQSSVQIVAGAKPTGDVTEELDLATLAPVDVEELDAPSVANQASGGAPVERAEHRADDHHHHAAERDGFDDVADHDGRLAADATHDAKLVLGAAPSTGTADDAKTQIARSPFLDDHVGAAEADAAPGRQRPKEQRTPRRGLPLGRPPSGSIPRRPSPSMGVGATLPLPQPPKPQSGGWVATGAGDSAANAASAARGRRWAVPAAMGAGLTAVLAATLWIARGPDRDPAPPAGTLSDKSPTGANEKAAAAGPPATGTTVAAPAPAPAPPAPSAVPPATPPPPAATSAEALVLDTRPAPPAGGPPAPSGAPVMSTSGVPAPTQAPTQAQAPPPPPARAPASPRGSAPPATAAVAVRAAATAQESGNEATPGHTVVAGQTNRPAVRRPPVRPVLVPPSASASPAAAASPGAATARTATALVLGRNDCAIRIVSRPWAEIWIDGKDTGRKTPVESLRVGCGTRKLELKRPDKDIEQMEMLTVVPGKMYRGSYELE